MWEAKCWDPLGPSLCDSVYSVVLTLFHWHADPGTVPISRSKILSADTQWRLPTALTSAYPPELPAGTLTHPFWQPLLHETSSRSTTPSSIHGSQPQARIHKTYTHVRLIEANLFTPPPPPHLTSLWYTWTVYPGTLRTSL